MSVKSSSANPYGMVSNTTVLYRPL